MKNLIFIILAFTLTGLMSCEKSNDSQNEQELICENDCLFTKEKVEGTIVYMACFEKYGIQTLYLEGEDIKIYGIPDDIEEAYQEEGKQIIFSAIFRENTLIPQFPDPSFDMLSLFEIDLVEIESVD